jgi:lipoate-protein ligase A
MQGELVFVIDLPKTGTKNMSIDWRNLLQTEARLSPFTLIRFYRWEQPTVSLGKHQHPEEAVDLAYCRERGIPIVSRPSGGRAVYHATELTYAVVSNDRSCFPISDIGKTYGIIASALQLGLSELELDTELAMMGTQGGPIRKKRQQKPCFMTPSRHELLVRGRKLVGSAQRRLKQSFLQHGSIPIDIDYEEMSQVLDVEVGALKRSMISLSEALGKPMDYNRAVKALKAGFQRKLLDCEGTSAE